MIIIYAPAGKYPEKEAEFTAKVNLKVKESFCKHCKSEKWVKMEFLPPDLVPSVVDACCLDVCAEIKALR